MAIVGNINNLDLEEPSSASKGSIVGNIFQNPSVLKNEEEPKRGMKMLPEKGDFAGTEAVLTTIPKMVGGALAYTGAAGLAGLAGNSFEESLHAGEEAQQKVMGLGSDKVNTIQGNIFEALGKGVDLVGRGAEAAVQDYARAGLAEPGVRNPYTPQQMEAGEQAGQPGARAVGEVAANLAPIPFLGRGGKQTRSPGPTVDPTVARATEWAKKQGRSNPTPQDFADVLKNKDVPEPQQLEFPDEIMRGRQQEAAAAEAAYREEVARQAAQGELQTIREQAAFGRELLSGTKDMFDNSGQVKDELLGPLQRSAKERPETLTEGSQAITEPLVQTPEREAPAGATQPGETVPVQNELPFPKEERAQGGIDYTVEGAPKTVTEQMKRPYVDENGIPYDKGLELNAVDKPSWTNKDAGWRSVDIETTGESWKRRKVDIIKEKGGGYVVEGPREPGSRRTYNYIHSFDTLKDATNYAKDYAAWLRGELEKRPNVLEDKYNSWRNIGKDSMGLESHEWNPEMASKAIEGDFRGALETIRDKSNNTFHKALAARLLDDLGFNPKLAVVDEIFTSAAAKAKGLVTLGNWHSAEGIKLSLKGSGAFSERIMLHEAMHAKVARLQYMYELGMDMPGKTKEAVEGIRNLYNHTITQLEGHYGLTDPYEFVAEAFTNPVFQDALKGLRIGEKSGLGLKQMATNAWDAFVHFIAKLLGLNPFKRNVLSETLNETAKLMKEIDINPEVAKAAYGSREGITHAAMGDWNSIKDVLRTNYNRADKATPKGYKDFMEMVSQEQGQDFVKALAEPVKKAMYDSYKKQFSADHAASNKPIGYDDRSLEQLSKEDLYNPEGGRKVDDVAPWGAQGPAAVAGDKHPILRRVFDGIESASIAVENLKNKWSKGAEIHGGYGLSNVRAAKRRADPNSLYSLDKKLNEKEKGLVMELAEQYGGKEGVNLGDEKFLRTKGASDKVVQFFKKWEEVRTDVLKNINDLRKKRGLDPIEALPNWFSRVRYGTFQTFAIDPKTAKHTYLAAFDTLADAEKVAKHMQETRGIQAVAAPSEHNPRVPVLPSEVFVEAAKRATDDPARHKLLLEAAKDAAEQSGIARFALHQDSPSSGYAGTKEIVGALGVEKAWDGFYGSIDHYINQAAKYVGSDDLKKFVSELHYDQKVKTDYPNAVAKAKYRYDLYSGAMRMGDEVLRNTSKTIAQIPVLKKWVGEDTLGNAVRYSSNFFTVSQLVMLNAKFYLANAIQFSTVPARMLELKNTTLAGGDVGAAILKGIVSTYLPTKEFKARMVEAQKRGALEARFAEALDWIGQEGTPKKLIEIGTTQFAAAMADTFSRAVTYNMMYELGKSAGLKGDKIHDFAARETTGIMLNYDKWARMPALNKLGVVGDTMAPLTQFISNVAFRYLEYWKEAAPRLKDGKIKSEFGPLLAFLGLSTAVAGVKGLPFYEDLEDVFIKLNQLYINNGGQYFGTPTEWISKVAPQAITDGIPSSASGVNLVGSLGSGNILSNVGNVPGLLTSFKAGRSGVMLALNAADIWPISEQEKQNYQTDVSPPQLRMMIENYYRNYADDDIAGWKKPFATPKSAMRDRQGNATDFRTDKENAMALTLGARPLNEANISHKKFVESKMDTASKAATGRAKEILFDVVEGGKQDIPEFVFRTLRSNPEMAADLPNYIKEEALRRNVPYDIRYILQNKAKGDQIMRHEDIR